jgi:hypothetical protein
LLEDCVVGGAGWGSLNHRKQGSYTCVKQCPNLLNSAGRGPWNLRLCVICFKGVVYLLKQIRKLFVKELYKELALRHLGINKTKEVVTNYYYFLRLRRTVKQVVKEYNIY